jgi:Xaa-Pro aminopeptidase
MNERLHALRTKIAGLRCSAFLTLHQPNLYYLCGFSGSSGALLVEQRRATLFTDTRYAIQAREEIFGASVKIVQGSLLVGVGERLGLGRGSLAFEAEHASIAQRKQLRRAVRKSVKLRPCIGLVEALRSVKDDFEIQKMKMSASLGSSIFDGVLPLLRPGVREVEIAAEIEYKVRRGGASAAAFETIVAFGERSALPHARATTRKLRRNELVVLDWGAILENYCSDMTRTVFVGKASVRVRSWYRAVQDAQEAARSKVRGGAVTGEVDAAARGMLEKRGLGRFFTHSTGHGLGLEVHEEPRVARGQTFKLRSGNVITIEPGIYVEGTGGIRIEDDVVVTANGCEVLTSASREFLEL